MVSRSEAGKYPQVLDLAFEDPVADFRVTATPLFSEKGESTGFLKIIRDRTRELTVLRSKNEFVTVASHQLRSPLTNITWALETLSKDETLSESNRSIASQALLGGKQLLGIVEDLLVISRIEDGRFGYAFEPVNLADFIAGILGTVLPRVNQLGIKLYFDKPADPLPPIMTDSTKLTMAMQNLLDNAFRYNVENGEVTVKIEVVPGKPYVKVSVKDTGIGLPTEEAHKIFTKFFRAENAMKTQVEGSGLGLYVAKNIIQAHGGQMGFESELGRGSTFYFTLPTDPSLVPQKEVALE